MRMTSAINEAAARAMIKDHFDASNITVAGGGPRDEIDRASEIYADDAVLEWPQGGERIRGKANIIAFRSAYPARQDFQLHRTTGCQNLWVNEYTIRYDERPYRVVGIMEFRDGKVARERIYFGEPWEPPAWRAQWVERMDPEAPQASVPTASGVRMSSAQVGTESSTEVLTDALERAAAAHGRHDQQTGEHDAEWPRRYAEHMTRTLAEHGYRLSPSDPR